MIRKHLLDSVKKHEGYRSQAYQDSVGVWTIGYGTNLQTLKVSRQWAENKLREDLEGCKDALWNLVPEFRELSVVRRDVLTEMAYNLGVNGLLNFRKMWSALREKDYERAAAEALDSKWRRQVGKRAETLAERIRTGVW